MLRHRLLPLLLVLVLAAAAGCSGNDNAQITSAAQQFLTAWAGGDVAAAAKATDDPKAAKAALTQATDALDPAKASLDAGKVTRSEDHARVSFQATWTLHGVPKPWTYTGRLALVRTDGTWRVHWQPSDLHPKLGADQKLSVQRSLPPRASILDSAGKPLFTPVDVVTVGIEPRRVSNLPQLAGKLATALDVTAGDIVRDVKHAKPTEFVPVITLRKPAYLKVRGAIHDLPGTVFQTGTRVLAPSVHFAQPLLGRVGDATAEVLKEAGSDYVAGDQLGLSGLQRAFNHQLTGTPTADIAVVDAKGETVHRLAHIAGQPGTPVHTTLDRQVQDAADAALAGVRQPAAIVAVRPSTGHLLAVANSAGASYDIALAGRYPAGSTFKVVSASAALEAGIAQPGTTLGCPGTVRIHGRVFPNEDEFDLGKISFKSAFAHSCNTTFTQLSQRLDDDALPDTAAQYGIGRSWKLPVPAFGGSVPTPDDPVEKAADAIGQGKVLVSPLAEALMAATVVRGSTPAPVLVDQPAQQATATPQPSSAPPAKVLPVLRDFMRAVVTDGTGRALRTAAGGPVSGKTGTAEHGTGGKLQAHSWFMGFQGDAQNGISFAVFVENGQTSGQLAIPLVAKFLAGLH